MDIYSSIYLEQLSNEFYFSLSLNSWILKRYPFLLPVFEMFHFLTISLKFNYLRNAPFGCHLIFQIEFLCLCICLSVMNKICIFLGIPQQHLGARTRRKKKTNITGSDKHTLSHKHSNPIMGAMAVVPA